MKTYLKPALLISSFLIVVITMLLGTGSALAEPRASYNFDSNGEFLFIRATDFGDYDNRFEPGGSSYATHYTFRYVQTVSGDDTPAGKPGYMFELMTRNVNGDETNCPGAGTQCRILVYADDVDTGIFYTRRAGRNDYREPPLAIDNGDQFAQWMVDNDGDPGSDDDESEADCDAGFGFNWIVCGAISLFESFMDLIINNFLRPLLETSPLTREFSNGEENPAYTIWKNVRNIANALLIPVFFFVIFSEVSSIKVDAYTIKKILPRLVAATIFIQASYFLVAIMVDITNVAGQGIDSLILSPVQDMEIDLSGGAEKVGIFGSIGLLGLLVTTGGLATIAGGALSIFLFLLPIVIATIATLLTLIFRQIVIIMLAVLAPVAFLAWILPNTEKWFKRWYDVLSKALLMYPLIMILLASGTLVAVIASQFGGGGLERGVGGLIAFVAVFAPLILVPFTFKLAGSAMALVGGAVTNMTNRAAVGKDGKGGISKGMREKVETRNMDMAAGAQPENVAGKWMMRTPGLRRAVSVGARPGIGVGQRAQSAALGRFNMSVGEAGKTLESEGVNDPRVLNEFAQHGGSRSELNKRIKKLSKTPGKEELAERLQTMSHHAGKNEVQAAALKKVAGMGLAEQESFDAVKGAFAGNPLIGQMAAGDAAYEAKKTNPALFAANTAKPGMKDDGTMESMDEAVSKSMDKTIRALGVQDWNNMNAERAFDEKTPHGREFTNALKRLRDDPQGEQTLRNLLSDASGLSTDKRNIIIQKTEVSTDFAKPKPMDVNIVGAAQVPQEPTGPPRLPGEQQRPSGLYVPGEDTTGGGVKRE